MREPNVDDTPEVIAAHEAWRHACDRVKAAERDADALHAKYIDARQAARVGSRPCCEHHNANCADIEEACCTACPTWVTRDGRETE